MAKVEIQTGEEQQVSAWNSITFFDIDLRNRPERDKNPEPGVNLYEDRSFAFICRSIWNPKDHPEFTFLYAHLDTLRGVGPIITDQTMGTSYLRRQSRPDGIFFAQNDEGATVPLAILEARSGIMTEEQYRDKINGLSALFLNLRQNQHREDYKLGKILNTALPSSWGLTDEIQIPDVRQIALIFVTPKPPTRKFGHPFRKLIHMRLSVPKEDRYAGVFG